MAEKKSEREGLISCVLAQRFLLVLNEKSALKNALNLVPYSTAYLSCILDNNACFIACEFVNVCFVP